MKSGDGGPGPQVHEPADRNERLAQALATAREEIVALRAEVEKLCAPASTYGLYLSGNKDGTVNILSQGRKVKVNLHPAIKVDTLKPGQELILNEGLNVV
ncbi:MAG: proteasome ATPase, partial [Candidatus Rokubacteria bacterium]|nr:proteasome ATPase [Candidatus Rokubacteria bacterium]